MGLERAALVEALSGLFDARFIEARREYENPFSLSLTADEIREALDGPNDPDDSLARIDYRLTLEGGRQWEAFAAPDWDRYVYAKSSKPSRSGRWNAGLITSSSDWRAERMLEGIHHLGRVVDRRRIHRWAPRPWRATYWKTLDAGYLIGYKFEEVESNWADVPSWMMRLYENRWYCWG